MAIEILSREMYSEAEAARLLRVAQGTLHYWLEGGVRRGKTYKPILREEATGDRAVTWAEFVEAGLLRQYRRAHKVPMPELRAFIEGLREALGVPYPLAHRRPYVADRQLVSDIQDEVGLDAEFCLVALVSGQTILTPASSDFVHRVEWADDIAAGWKPHADPDSPVRIDPLRRFGKPSIDGISTDVLWEQSEGGDYIEDTAEAFELTVEQVRWALAYENSLRAA